MTENVSKLSERLTLLLDNKNGISPLKRKVTRAELAKALGVKPQTASLWSLGNTEPTASTIILIARYFGVSTDFLLGASDDIGNAEFEKANLAKLARVSEIANQLIQEIER